MHPRVPAQLQKIAKAKAKLNGQSLGEYISVLIEKDCSDLLEHVGVSVGETKEE